MTESTTKKLIEEKEEEMRKLQKEIDFLNSLPPNGICLILPLKCFDDLNPSISESLSRAGIVTVKYLIYQSDSQILKIRNIGPCKFQLIKDWLKKYDLHLLN